MVCYSDRTVKFAERGVLGISVVFLLLGLIVAILAAAQDKIKQDDVKLGNFELPKMDSGMVQMAALAMGVIAIFIACCGIATAKWKNKFIILPYMILAALIGLICLIVGTVVSGYGGNLASQGIDKICIKVNEGSNPIGTQYDKFVSKVMCTSDCPCFSGEGGETKKMWMKYTDNDYKPFDVTKG
jgi:hypothetical protein